MKPITIKAEKVITISGKPGYRIISVDALRYAELPREYIVVTGDCIYAEKRENTLYCRGVSNMQYGDIFTESEFAECIAYIRKAANRLHDINEARKKLRAEWCTGIETVII